MSITPPLHVMIIDDDSDDADFLVGAFVKQNSNTFFEIFLNGQDALDNLTGIKMASPEMEIVYPDVIFLDLHLPGKSGLQILKEIKNNSALCTIPVMIISSSMLEEQKELCKDEGSEGFFTKPMTLEEYDNTAIETISYLLSRKSKTSIHK